jgi:glycosyltransferase involved in cell wall biosynthesis
MSDDFAAAGIPVHLIRKQRTVDVRLVVALCQFLRREHVAIVHAFSSTAEFFGGIAAVFCGSRFLASIRGYDDGLPGSHHWAKKAICALADAVVANSRAGAHAAVTASVAASAKVRVIRNGIEPYSPSVSRTAARQQLGVSSATIAVLSVGRLVWEKGYEATVDMAVRIKERHPHVRFFIVGDGPLHGSLAQRIQLAGLTEHVQLLGERRDIPLLLAAADVYLNTSVSEGLSNSIMEAMAAEVPVLASAVGGTPELVREGESGLLFPVGEEAIAVEKLGRLICDANLRRTLALQGRQVIVSKHRPEVLVSHLESLYHHILARDLHREFQGVSQS